MGRFVALENEVPRHPARQKLNLKVFKRQERFSSVLRI